MASHKCFTAFSDGSDPAVAGRMDWRPQGGGRKVFPVVLEVAWAVLDVLEPAGEETPLPVMDALIGRGGALDQVVMPLDAASKSRGGHAAAAAEEGWYAGAGLSVLVRLGPRPRE